MHTPMQRVLVPYLLQVEEEFASWTTTACSATERRASGGAFLTGGRRKGLSRVEVLRKEKKTTRMAMYASSKLLVVSRFFRVNPIILICSRLVFRE